MQEPDKCIGEYYKVLREPEPQARDQRTKTEFWWRVRHRANRRIMATPHEGYRSKQYCIERFRFLFDYDIELVEIETPDEHKNG